MFKFSQNKTRFVIFLFVIFAMVPLFGISQTTIDIQVAPNVLNLQNNGQVVTIHTDIAYSAVLASTVSLNGIVIDSWKADAQGYFVAKFVMEAIKNLPLNIGEMNELTVNGEKVSGETFTGTSEVLVKNVIPKGRK